jgi:hypothetical protein
VNGNNPHAGLPGITEAGKRAQADLPELTDDQRRGIRREIVRIAARTREFLPDEYVVDSNVAVGISGPRGTVAVHPPAGHPVSADLSLELDGSDFDVDDDDREEVARGLAASAALQVKRSVKGDISQTAR